ncbi:MAG: PEGA domain-containing protein [Thermomicrobiales bacterium]
MAPGEHEVEVRATGYRAFVRRVVVRHGADVRVSANLIQETSVVTRWWFWTAVGAAAVGAASVGLYLALREEPTIPGVNQMVDLLRGTP